jgi:hypothetical protein
MSRERNPKLSIQMTDLINKELEKKIRETKYYDDSIWYEKPVKPSVFYSDYLNTPAYPIQAETIDTILVEEREGEIHWRSGIYNESYLLWGEGSGKDWTSSRLMCYALYWLLCLKRPHEYFKMKDPKAPIEMINVSFDEDQALYVYFKELKKALGSTIDPKDGKNWFEKRGMKIKESSKQQIIEFPNYISCYSLNSREHKVEGKGTLMAVFDEMAVFKTGKAKELYDNVISNMRSRFPKEHKFIALSYKRDDFDYMMVRWDQTKNDPLVYRSRKATWEVNLRVKREDLQKSYDENPEEAERRFECVGTTSKSGYFKYRDKIKENVNTLRSSPILEETIPIRNISGMQFADGFKGDPNFEYKAHIDLAKGKDTANEIADCAGLTLGHKEETEDEEKPKIVIDLMCQIKAPRGREIEFEDIRQLLYKLISMGFNISEVTLDGYQSTDFMQILRKRGIKAELLSVDKDNSAYDSLKSLIYNKRIDYYYYPVFIRECEELQLIGGKADHPDVSRRRALEENGDDRGSKDVSDSVAAVCKSLISEERKKPNSKWMPLSDDTPIKKNTDQVIVDENKREYGSNYKIDTDDEDEV